MVFICMVVIYGVAYVILTFQNSIKDEELKQQKSKFTNTYYDHNGKLRDADTNALCSVFRKDGQTMVKDQYGNVKNATLNELQNKRLFFMVHPELHVTAFLGISAFYSSKPSLGDRYFDVKTGRFYYIRKVRGILFYMDAETNKLIRKTDGQVYYDKTFPHRAASEEMTKEIIEKANSGEYYVGFAMGDIYNYEMEYDLHIKNKTTT